LESPTPIECSDDLKARERKAITSKVAALLRPELMAAQGANGPTNVEAMMRAISYEVIFSKTCQSADVTPILRIPGLALPKLRQFKCLRTRDEWSCR
jgi:hypothetical protein